MKSAIAICRELDWLHREAANSSRWVGLVEWLAGAPVAAERGLRRGYDELEPRGDAKMRAVIASDLARMVYLQRRFDEAFESRVKALALEASQKGSAAANLAAQQG